MEDVTEDIIYGCDDWRGREKDLNSLKCGASEERWK